MRKAASESASAVPLRASQFSPSKGPRQGPRDTARAWWPAARPAGEPWSPGQQDRGGHGTGPGTHDSPDRAFHDREFAARPAGRVGHDAGVCACGLAPEPDRVARAAPAPESGRGFRDLVTVSVRQGLEAVDILRRAEGAGLGPVLHDGVCGTLGFLVPAGTAACWDLPGSRCTRTLSRTRTPGPGGGWLLPSGDRHGVTDPDLLRAALGEAARLLRAADTCH